MPKVQARLDGADAVIRSFKHRDVDTFLATEVVVDHPLASLSACGDRADPGATEALLGEFPCGHPDAVAPRPLGVGCASAAALLAAGSFAPHADLCPSRYSREAVTYID